MFSCLATEPQLRVCFFYYMAAHPKSIPPVTPICTAPGLLSVSRTLGRKGWDSPQLWSSRWPHTFCTLPGWSGQQQQLEALCLDLLRGSSDYLQTVASVLCPPKMKEVWRCRPPGHSHPTWASLLSVKDQADAGPQDSPNSLQP